MRQRILLLLALVPAGAGAFDNIAITATLSLKKQIARPVGAAFAPDGRLVVSDASGRVAVTGGKGFVDAVEKGKGALKSPAGVAFDASGRLYVADEGADRVAVYGKDGKFLFAVGGRGAGAGSLKAPSGVALSPDGFLFVADTGNHRVQIFSADGIPLGGFGAAGVGEGQLKSPRAVALGPTGRVYVMDEGHGVVQVFRADGRYVGALARPDRRPSPARPVGLGVDAFGYVYVADGANRKVEEYDPEGAFIGAFGAKGVNAGQFRELTALAVSPEGQVAVLDGDLSRLQVYRVESAEKVRAPAPLPFGRLRVSAEPPVKQEAVGLAALGGGRLAASLPKKNQIVLLSDQGRGASVTWAERGDGPGQIGAAGALFARDGVLLAVDAPHRRIARWGADGAPLSPVSGSGAGEGRFKNPRAAAVDALGRLWVADAEAGKLHVFGRDGVFLFAPEAPGTLKRPVGLAPIPRGMAVLDETRKALLIFDEKGKFFAESGGLTAPTAVAGDALGRPILYVLDGGAGQVRVWVAGQWAGAFGASGFFTAPRSIAMDEGGRLWVADGASLRPFAVTLAPGKPEKFTASSDEGVVRLAWAADAQKLTESYALRRSTAPRPGGAPYAVLPATAAAFTDDDIIPGLTYYYSLAPRPRGAADWEGPRAGASLRTLRPANLPPLEIGEAAFDRVFSAQYKYYTDHPVGVVTVKNNTERTFQKLRVGFTIQDFMDFPTETVLERLEPGERRELSLKAVFNNRILAVTEDTPIQARISVDYFEEGAPKSVQRAQPFRLYSRNAMIWGDLRRLGTFLTPKDPPALEFSRGVVGAFEKEIADSPLDEAFGKAAFLWEALGAQGLTYAKDPNGTESRSSREAVDYIQYPRETIRRKSGDCDDLTVLLATLLESVAVPTAVAELPGHVLLLFPTEADLPEDLGVMRDGRLWLPVETTRVGKPFAEALRQGLAAWRVAEGKSETRVVDAAEAWALYAPATLSEAAVGAAPSREAILKRAPGALSAAEKDVFDRALPLLTAAAEADPRDEARLLRLGLFCADFDQWDAADAWFGRVLAVHPDHPSALNNRGNIALLQGETARARAFYTQAAAADPSDGGIQLNLARAARRAGDRPAAEAALSRAWALQPELKTRVSRLEDL